MKHMLRSSVPRPIDHAKREELLAAAGSVLARTGVTDTSLRTLAAEMGTSARMLVYYFGSKERLILDVMNRQQRAAIPETDKVERPASMQRTGNGVSMTGTPAPVASAVTPCE
jgi:AcrR family transcriptional regulator